MKVWKVWVINGPNLNLLGVREPEVYGTKTLSDLEAFLRQKFQSRVEFHFFQSNHEGQLVDWVQDSSSKADLVLLNPAAYTHTSMALADAISAIKTPVVEVHLSNPAAREEIRRTSFTAPYCMATVAGFGFYSYQIALEAWLKINEN